MRRCAAVFLSVLAGFISSNASATRLSSPSLSNRRLKAFTRSTLSGGASRAIAQMTLYPIDTLRTLAQSRDGRTLSDVGLRALVRGSFTTSSFALFIGAIQFSVFGACRDRVGPLGASALGAAASCIVSVPQEVIKQRLVTGIYPSFRSAVLSIAKNEGVAGFYSAWKPTIARNIPFVMITFTTMDALKKILRRRNNEEKRDLGIWDNVALGMSAAFVAGIVTNPMDVIKTRMMTQAASMQVPYTSAIDCMLTIARTEGMGTFYSGFKQRSTYMCLLWGMAFAINGLLQRKMQEN